MNTQDQPTRDTTRGSTYLDKIVAFHRERNAACNIALEELLSRAAQQEIVVRRSFFDAISAPGLSVIAELKRRSPSKGLLGEFDAEFLAHQYQLGGAAALSVLTDEPHFGGSVNDLGSARGAVSIPVLRKDFIVSAKDVVQTYLMGADCVLLIAACLSQDELIEYSCLADSLGLSVLFEIHDEAELEKVLPANPKIVGVNQRDLYTFAVDATRALRVCSAISPHILKVAESGIDGPQSARELFVGGFDAVLVGETFVRSIDPQKAVKEFSEIGKQ